MEPLVLRSRGPFAVGFTLHLRGEDPQRRATREVVLGTVVHGAPKAESWVSFPLFADRRPRRDADERACLQPGPNLRPEHGPALRRCAREALRVLPEAFLCDPQDREGLTFDDPDHLMVFLDLPSYEATVAVLAYYALGFGAEYPFMREDPGFRSILALVDFVGAS